MTRERAAELLSEVMVLDDPEMAEAHRVAISALRQQEHFRDLTKKVEPLTMDELRQMDGEPVWVQFLHNKIGYWYLIDCHNSEFIRFYRSGFFINGEYSKSFLAYRQKTEEGTV